MRTLARALDTASATRSRLEKVVAIAGVLKEAAARGEVELTTSARIVAGRLVAPSDGRPLGVGSSIILEAASLVRGVPESWIAKRARELGDLGDGIAELLAADTHETRRRASNHRELTDPRQLSLEREAERFTLPPEAERHRGLSIRDVADIAEAIATAPAREAKTELIAVAIARATAAESRYLVKALLGELRVGVRAGVFEDALAKAFDATIDAVRAAATVETDPGELALLASRGALASAQARVFHPIAFMLAAPDESVVAPIEADKTIFEDKLDGVRAQLHVQDGRARLFARGQGEVGRSFPEVLKSFESVAGPLVLDGEILAVLAERRARPFQALQARLNRVDPDATLLETVPVHYFAFDVLIDREPVFALPWSLRRARLERVFEVNRPACASLLEVTPLDPARPIDEQLATAYETSRARGHEGIVLKRIDAPYEAGRRGAAWRKVKRAFATLDVVITVAERGHGRRANVLSDYTFAVKHEGELLDVGKAYSGLTDAEIATMTERLEALTIERRGSRQRVRPEIVLEVAFDGIQRSKRHPSGFALRFPRINRIRDDKTPEDADDLATVARLFESQVASGHREDPKTKARRRKNVPQLGLFDERSDALGDDDGS